jgi:hypothetical protein
MFNGGFSTSPEPDALGRKTGEPNFLKGHSWITKKAMDYLQQRGLLPAVLTSDRYKKYLYYGTTYADWLWMGRPEDPDGSVWSPVVKALDAVDDLCHGTPPSSPSCPYNDNCTTGAVQSLCRLGRDPFGSDSNPCTSSPKNPDACNLCSPSHPDQAKFVYNCDSLAANLGRVAAADCANPSPHGYGLCATPPVEWPVTKNTTPAYGAFSGFDHTYKCLLGSDSAYTAHRPCMNIATARFRKEDVAFAYDLVGINLNLNVTAIMGLGNSYQRASLLALPTGSINGNFPWWYSASREMDVQLLETNLPFHQNPAMLFRISLNLGGDAGWISDWFLGGGQWNDPTIQDFALDNLYHYPLSDISNYDASAFGQWGQPRDPTGADPDIEACNQLVNNPPYNSNGYPQNRFDYAIVSQYEWCLDALSPYGTSVLAFPFRAADFAAIGNEYPSLKQEAFYQLNLQPAYGQTGYGAAKYGSILYQFARKFFKGSPATPTMADMIKAGNDVPGWKTGGSYGTQSVVGGADFRSGHLDFPHTYLGGNPFICSGGRTSDDSTDSCANGDPTWPIWVPDDYDPNDRDGFLNKLKSRMPNQSNRAALIYLGWASHLMQDLALPHHASNWSGLRHAAQDSYGDMYAFADAIVSDPNTPVVLQSNHPCSAFNNITDDKRAWLQVALNQFGHEMDALVTQMVGSAGPVNWSGEDIDRFCQSTGLARGGISDTDINWNAVYTSFLRQGQTAFSSRQMGTDDQCSPTFVGYPYAKNIIKNSILATMKLILCAAPHDAEPLAAPDQVRAVPVHDGVDLTWVPVNGATGYVVYIAKSGSNDYTVLGEVTDSQMPSTGNLSDGTTYTIYVVAQNGNGIEGPPSAVVTATPHTATCPAAPHLWAEPGNAAVVLHWTPMPETAFRYHVFTTIGENPAIIDLGYANEPTFTASINGYDGHYFWVKAENSDCSTPTSNIVATAWGMGRLPAPKNFAVTPINHGADLYWDPVEGAAGYVVFLAIGDSGKFVEVGTTTGQDATGFLSYGYLNGKKLSYFVAATTAFDILGYRSDTQETVAGSGSVPSSTQLWAQPGDGQVTLRWLGVPYASTYNLWMKTDASANYTETVCWTRDTTCTVTGLTNGTTYYFAVEGASSDYPSGNPQSNTVPVSPNMAVLPYPSGVRATPITGPRTQGIIDLTWDPVPGAARYVVYQDQATSGPSDYRLLALVDAVPANQVNITFSPRLTYGTSYNFAVAALDANAVEGERRWPISKTAAESPQLVAPSVTTEAGDGQVTLNWAAVPGASFYWVWMKTTEDVDFTNDDVWRSWTLQTADTFTVLDQLSNGVTTYFWVQAGNSTISEGVGYLAPMSTAVSATPQLRCPGEPQCSGHGTCNAGTCECQFGYSTADCSVTCPNGPTCSGRGTCTEGACVCQGGFSGPDCSVTCPGGPSCTGHGTCTNGVCGCQNGYSGPDCSVTCPNGPTCSGHGTCTNGMCGCQNGYSGPDCSVTCPGGPSCSGHGTCSNGVCTCAVGYSGASCSVNCGSSFTCPNGTACTNNNQCVTRSCVNGVCKALGCAPNCTAGTACGASGDCGSRVCTNGTCQAPSCAPHCGQGSACGVNSDCVSSICSTANSTCQPPSCAPHCNQGVPCGANGDCGSGVCASNLCQAPTCSPQCAPGASCGVNADCLSKVCTNNVCVAPSCSPRCAQGASCGVGSDCLSRVCTSGTCRIPACSPRCSRGAACGSNTDCTSRVCSNGICG